MASRLGGIKSEAQSTPSAGLASILRDHNAIFGASNGRSNVVIGMVEALGTQSVFVACPPESSFSEADIAADDWNEFEEGDLWAVENKFCQPDLPRSLQISYNGVPSLDPRIDELKIDGTAENVGVVLGLAKVDVDVADSLELGVKAKKKESGAMGEHELGYAKQRASAGEVVRSSARRRERRQGVSDALKNVGLYCHAQVQGGRPSNPIPSRCSTAALMIPQFGGGTGRKASKRHAERQSAPVQVPDWSKIKAKQSGKRMIMMDDGEEGDKDNDDDRLPPHELLRKEYARSQITTFSVCEGQGRTLKGRDLSRVRDAVWSQMGFAD